MSSDKILVYDGECSMCESMSALLLRVLPGVPGVPGIPGDARRPLQDFPLETAARLDAAGIRNEMAVIAPASGEIRSGIAGILWLLQDTAAAPLARLLDRPLLRGPLTIVYRTISYNRRVLAPPLGRPAGFRCTCDPDDRPGYQLALIAGLLGLALALTVLFGAAVASGTGLESRGRGALQMVIAAGSGWVVLLLALGADIGLPRDVRLRFVGHLGMVMVRGLLVLVPSMLLSLVLSGAVLGVLGVLFGLSVTASFLLMLRDLDRRLRFLGLSRAWLAGWAAALWAGATASVWFFFWH